MHRAQLHGYSHGGSRFDKLSEILHGTGNFSESAETFFLCPNHGASPQTMRRVGERHEPRRWRLKSPLHPGATKLVAWPLLVSETLPNKNTKKGNYVFHSFLFFLFIGGFSTVVSFLFVLTVTSRSTRAATCQGSRLSAARTAYRWIKISSIESTVHISAAVCLPSALLKLFQLITRLNK